MKAKWYQLFMDRLADGIERVPPFLYLPPEILTDAGGFFLGALQRLAMRRYISRFVIDDARGVLEVSRFLFLFTAALLLTQHVCVL